MNKKIYLIRHGEIDYGKERRYIGITDLPLSNKGIEQMKRMKDNFVDLNVEKIYCSPLLRCRQTAEILLEAKNVELVLVKELEEINMGSWENESMATIRSRFPKLYEERGKDMAGFTPPNGESFEQLQRRVFPAFQRILESTHERSMIIAHAGVNRVILAKLKGLSLDKIFQIEQTYGCINELSFDDNLNFTN